MFDQIFERPCILARYRTGPLVDERIGFLTHLVNQDYSRLACGRTPVICLRLRR